MQNKEQIMEYLKKNQSWILPGILALLGALFLYQGMNVYKQKLGYGMEAQNVVVAARSLPEGHTISKNDLEIVQEPQKYLPVGTLLESDLSKAVQHVVTRPIAKGEIVLWSAIDTGFSPVGPARRVAKGYRAIAVKVNPVTAVGQAVRPGDHVDILTTTTIPGEKSTTTVAVLQNVAVLDIGLAEQEEQQASYSTMTLMVLPKEMGLITYAQENGTLMFALRNPEDHRTVENLPMVGQEQLIESAFRNSIQEERNNAKPVEIIRGGRLSFDRIGID
jgi:pilus assembly protein CpaB